MRRTVANICVLFASLAVCLVLSEAVARVALNPADFLSATTVKDDILGIRIAAGSSGFDEWGFRNPRVPLEADIVAVGDSHTYGNNATMAESWPYVVARVTGQRVYNLALGGYGPNQYSYLMETRALRLHPHWVVCGLYLGDDFENAFRMTYGNDYWAMLRGEVRSPVDADIWTDAEDRCGDASSCTPAWHRRLRMWMSRRSVVYRLLFHGTVGGRVKGLLQIRYSARRQDGGTASLFVREAGVEEAFRPIGIRDRVDQRSPAVREGMRITFELLRKMAAACREHGCRLLVVVIPTKESVFAEYVAADREIRLKEIMADLVEQEAVARVQLFEFLDRGGIAYVDTLPALRRRIGDHLYTPSDRDMHPNKNGYRVIGEVVGEYLERERKAGTDRETRHALGS